MGGKHSSNSPTPLNIKRRRDVTVAVDQILDQAESAKENDDWKRASKLFEDAAELSLKGDTLPSLSASYFHDAADCAQKLLDSNSSSASSGAGSLLSINTYDADRVSDLKLRRVLVLLEKSASLYEQGKRRPQAATVQKEIAGLFENAAHLEELAAKYYSKAGKNFDSANYVSCASECHTKYADLITPVDAAGALKVYMDLLATLSRKSKLQSSRGLPFKIILLTASVYDVDKANEVALTFRSMPQLNYDVKRAKDVLEAMEEEDLETMKEMQQEARDVWTQQILEKLMPSEANGQGGGTDSETLDLR